MVLSEQEGRGWEASTALTDQQLAALSGLEESDRDLRTVRLAGLGDYRVAVADLEGGRSSPGCRPTRSTTPSRS